MLHTAPMARARALEHGAADSVVWRRPGFWVGGGDEEGDLGTLAVGRRRCTSAVARLNEELGKKERSTPVGPGEEGDGGIGAATLTARKHSTPAGPEEEGEGGVGR
jgi:hypothetical protein